MNKIIAKDKDYLKELINKSNEQTKGLSSLHPRSGKIKNNAF